MLREMQQLNNSKSVVLYYNVTRSFYTETETQTKQAWQAHNFTAGFTQVYGNPSKGGGVFINTFTNICIYTQWFIYSVDLICKYSKNKKQSILF